MHKYFHRMAWYHSQTHTHTQVLFPTLVSLSLFCTLTPCAVLMRSFVWPFRIHWTSNGKRCAPFSLVCFFWVAFWSVNCTCVFTIFAIWKKVNRIWNFKKPQAFGVDHSVWLWSASNSWYLFWCKRHLQYWENNKIYMSSGQSIWYCKWLIQTENVIK